MANPNPSPATRFKPGQSGNEKGRPPDDESMSGIMRQVVNMTPKQILEWLPADNPLGKAYKDMPQNVQLKTLLVLRLLDSQMFDPNGVITREIYDRLEGRVPFKAEVNSTLTVEHLHAMLDQVYGEVVDGEEVGLLPKTTQSASVSNAVDDNDSYSEQ